MVERKDVSAELERKLPVGTQYCSAALWGLGGCGKTQVALDFAYRRLYESHYSVFWVYANNHTSFLDDYKKIAHVAGLSDSLENDDLLKAVRAWIESLPRWLLVLDNSDALRFFEDGSALHEMNQTQGLFAFVPHGTHGAVLWTTRDERILGSLVSPNQGVCVESMLQREAESLLVSQSKQAITEENHEAVLELLSRLERLPLAIMQAANYLRRKGTTFNGYVEKLRKEKRRWRVLEESRFDRHRQEEVPNTVLRTWNISIDYIRHESPCAYKILHIVTYFNNQDIPFELVKAAALRNIEGDANGDRTQDQMDDEVETKLGESDDEGSDDDIVVEAATRLKEFSFLRLRNASDRQRSYEMHKLVQEATRYSLNSSEEEEGGLLYSRAALETMLEMFPASSSENWWWCEKLLAHALRVCSWPEVSREKLLVANLLTAISNYLFDQGRSQEKEIVEVRALELRQEVLGDKHPDTIRSMAGLAATYHQQGRSSEAEQISLEVLRLRQEVLGDKHPDTIRSVADLASIYAQQGRSHDAKQLEAAMSQV